MQKEADFKIKHVLCSVKVVIDTIIATLFFIHFRFCYPLFFVVAFLFVGMNNANKFISECILSAYFIVFKYDLGFGLKNPLYFKKFYMVSLQSGRVTHKTENWKLY